MSNPTNLRYTAEHEWLALDGELARVGVTAFAADALGDVVYVDLPQVGATITAGESCGELESTKSVSDLYAPVTGEVVEVNEAVDADPSLVNSDPFGAGWLFVVKVAETGELLDAAAYDALLDA
ncbi:glycine cleavage system protein GcvH [Pimelobacter simplex]|uniref:Glycine cleavage system H protein n=1 Tax=Nocardioides simplex TaxID=2045 RepID=A0A0A1DKR8_NOCSI|nr:glycine cleavage system protein GcvH [Pimelobacter simplex]AIY17939.1 Glycine cleavage system H protein [Pimelobacter simplex]KAB2810797.1 glycine cleavage system protein GcvH [Pimelobacter simplex]MCG8152654.1 glycine cleavage system protein GcvH [Pimelobacter simplex]SFM75430.1 glycine cleavage system H protein [Pimelobacter simplex]GEB16970.1 glycine cleavage system H protein [Pimelobacter simplex]